MRFLSDGESSATGFRVLATLVPCAAAGVVHDVAVEGDGVGNRSASLGCCGRVHAGVQLFITSPGFPTGLGLADCVFPVARWSPQTCRVRLVLHHFLLLGSLAACDKHFLEVDGRRLCGCQSRAQFVSYFRVDEAVKQFRYFRHPLVTGAFMVEVIQEDCSGPFGAMGGPPFRGGWPARSTDGRATWSVGNVTSDIKRWGQVRFPEAGSHSGLTKTLPKGSGDWGSEYPQQGPQYPQQGPQDFLPGAQYPQQGPQGFLPGAQYPQQGPQYPQEGPQDFLPGAQYPQQGPQDFLPGAQYPQEGPQDFLPGAQYPQQGPQYPQQGPQYPQPGSQYPTQPSDQGPHATPEDGVDSSCCFDADLPQSLDAGRSAALGVLPTCGAPSYKDWMARAAAWAQTVPSALVQCPVGIFPLAKCRKLEGLNGFFATPRYPDLYPNNARICYRILRYPEQCGVQMTFLDFDLEPSPACNKDYVSLGGSSRYCGSTLLSTTLYLSFESSLYIDILFVTDDAVSARGFRASFRQVACGAPGVIGGQGPGPFPSSIPGPVQGGVSDVVPLYPGGLPGGVPGAPAIMPGFFPGDFPGRTPGVVPSIFPGAIPGGVPGGPPIGVPAIGAGAYPGGFPTIGYPGPVPGAYPEYGPPYRPRPVPVSEEGPYQASGQPERPPVLPDYPRYPEPTTPAPAPPLPPPRTPPPPVTVCGGDVRQQQFALSLRDVFSHPECVFTVRRVSQDICGLQVRVERMGLDCQREHLVVGDRTLCGADLVGQTVMVDFFGDAVQILYQGEASAQGDFFVHLQQVADCLELDVTPVARFGKAAPDDVATP
ncbi:hypothetical protein FOCC_FOCC014714, partial [Frankliniella occidentalis]